MYTAFCVFIIGLQLVSGASTKRSIDDPHRIKYPGPIKEITNKFGSVEDDDVTVTVPDECKGKNYCTIKPPDYPQEVFNDMFKDYKPIPMPVVEEDDELGNRHSDPGDKDGCETRVTYAPLYHVRSQEGDWRTVIQAPDKDYIQRVRLEECKHINKRCFTVFPDIGIETACKQKFNVWKVLVATKNGSETIRTDLPVCCSCKYREISKSLSELMGV